MCLQHTFAQSKISLNSLNTQQLNKLQCNFLTHWTAAPLLRQPTCRNSVNAARSGHISCSCVSKVKAQVTTCSGVRTQHKWCHQTVPCQLFIARAVAGEHEMLFMHLHEHLLGWSGNKWVITAQTKHHKSEGMNEWMNVVLKPFSC